MSDETLSTNRTISKGPYPIQSETNYSAKPELEKLAAAKDRNAAEVGSGKQARMETATPRSERDLKQISKYRASCEPETQHSS